MRAKPWEVPEGLWQRIEPLLPRKPVGSAIRVHAWQAGVWEKLHELLLAELHAADQLEWERAVADSSHLQAKKGAPRPGRARSTGAAAAASTTCS